MNDKLSSWLSKELERRGWSHRELARRAGVSQTAVSQAISEDRNVGWDFCAAIAEPLGKTPQDIFRIAGLLPLEPEPREDENQLLTSYRKLPSPQREFILDILRGLQGMLPSGEVVIHEHGLLILPTRNNSTPPTLDEINDLSNLLDEPERWIVYDFIQWRLIQQELRRDSNGIAPLTIEEFYRLYRAVTKLSAAERDAAINGLLGRRTARLKGESENLDTQDNYADISGDDDSPEER